MAVEPQRVRYQSFLLRLWWDAAQAGWRVSLQNTADEGTHYFVNVAALAAFLESVPEEQFSTSAVRSSAVSD